MRTFTILTVALSLIVFSKTGIREALYIPKARLVTSLSQNVRIDIVKNKTKVLVGHYRHVVKSGDSLWSISRKFTVLQWIIREQNPALGKILFPGQVIKIPLIAWKKYQGRASWYGPGFHLKKMASGERYDQNEILIAHRHYPIGLVVRVTNLQNGLSVIARVEDRGPYAETDLREVDLSLGAARALKSVGQGVVPVKIEPLNTHLKKWVRGFEQLV